MRLGIAAGRIKRNKIINLRFVADACLVDELGSRGGLGIGRALVRVRAHEQRHIMLRAAFEHRLHVVGQCMAVDDEIESGRPNQFIGRTQTQSLERGRLLPFGESESGSFRAGKRRHAAAGAAKAPAALADGAVEQATGGRHGHQGTQDRGQRQRRRSTNSAQSRELVRGSARAGHHVGSVLCFRFSGKGGIDIYMRDY